MPDGSSTGEPPDLDELLHELRRRVELRRRDGVYPAGLESDLDGHFAHLTGDRPPSQALPLDELDDALAAIEHFLFSQGRISAQSELPGGGVLHRAVGRAVGRQVQGVLEQAQDYAHRVARAMTLLADTTTTVADVYDKRVLQQLDDLQLQLAEQQRALNQLLLRLDDVTARLPGAQSDAWYSGERFVARFRGPIDEVRERYRDLAELFVGCTPVLDAGFGRGEFLELLTELGVDAMGIEVDPVLVDLARGKGLRAEIGGTLEYLGALADGALGGLAMIQVIEHLPPRHVVELVRLVADKVRRGGRVVIETVNPTSMVAYARAFWIDPDHMRPVHPSLLQFLFEEAGFAHVHVALRSPVEPDVSLELLAGDDEVTKRLNANFERLNALVFAPQDYALIATR